MRRRTAVVTGLVAATQATAAIAGAAVASRSERSTLAHFTVHGTGTMPLATPEDLAEAQQLASSTGASVDRALTYSLVTGPWDDVANGLEALAPDDYVSAYRTGVEDTGASVVFVHQPPAAVLRALKSLPIDTTVYVGAPVPARILEDAANSADTALYGTALTPVTATTDAATGSITVEVRAGATPQQLADGEATVSAAVAKVIGPVVLPTKVVTTTHWATW